MARPSGDPDHFAAPMRAAGKSFQFSAIAVSVIIRRFYANLSKKFFEATTEEGALNTNINDHFHVDNDPNQIFHPTTSRCRWLPADKKPTGGVCLPQSDRTIWIAWNLIGLNGRYDKDSNVQIKTPVIVITDDTRAGNVRSVLSRALLPRRSRKSASRCHIR